jgi:hypothetical protein
MTSEAELIGAVEELERVVLDEEVSVSRSALEEMATRILIRLDGTEFADRTLRKRLVARVQCLVPEQLQCTEPECDENDEGSESPAADQVPEAEQPPILPSSRQLRSLRRARGKDDESGDDSSDSGGRASKRTRQGRVKRVRFVAPSPAPSAVVVEELERFLSRCRIVMEDCATGRLWFNALDGLRYYIVKTASYRSIPCFAMELVRDDPDLGDSRAVGYAVMFGGYDAGCSDYFSRMKGTCWIRMDPCLYRVVGFVDEAQKCTAVPESMVLVDGPDDWSKLETMMVGYRRNRGPTDMYKMVVRSMGCESSWKAAKVTTQAELESELESRRRRYLRELNS